MNLVHDKSQEYGDHSDEEHDRPIERIKKRLQISSDSESGSDNEKTEDSRYSTEIVSKIQKSISNTENDSDEKVSKNNENTVDIDNTISYKHLKKRVQQFSDHENEYDKENKINVSPNLSNDDEHLIFKKSKQKSRIEMVDQSDGSDSVSSAEECYKNEQQQLRMKNKRNKLQQKFKTLITSRKNEAQTEKNNRSHSVSESENGNDKHADSSEGSGCETSIEKIKQNIKEKSTSYKTTICDPDTSDEESNHRIKSMLQKKMERKSTKLTSPKPVRMTAKQAMENMKKIKSESNRMLREKEVTLPYHRPKALSLKDIMNRRKPAVTCDGKSLPIKMNEEQLKQYAKLLEERQKEMMELCKSDTSDEDTEESVPQTEKIKETENTEYSENPKQIVNNETEDTIRDSNNIITLENTNESMMESVESNKSENNINKTSTAIGQDIDISDNNASHNGDKAAQPANDSMNSNASNAEMSLVYNDSIEEINMSADKADLESNNKEKIIADEIIAEVDVNKVTEPDSQLISLHYDTDKTDVNNDTEPNPSTSKNVSDIAINKVCRENDFSDDDMVNMDEIDNLIENAEIFKDNNGEHYANSPMLINDPYNPTLKPKLTGAPGMVIDLDGTDAVARKKLSGLELLKERFTYFAKLKTPEELEREKEKRIKPGVLHLKLKQELEDQIAEQRSLEWAKRLEEEKHQQMEIDAIRGDESDDDIGKIEAKLHEKEETLNEESSESEESEEEMQEIKEKPRKKNPMIDDEAEESDIEEFANDESEIAEEKEDHGQDNDADDEVNNEDDSEDSSEESSESEEETETITKKGRILKAFEDSDEEDADTKNADVEIQATNKPSNNFVTSKNVEEPVEVKVNSGSQVILDSQDEDIQLAQRHKSFSGDLFTSQESTARVENNISASNEGPDIGTQTFSILNDGTTSMTVDLEAPEKLTVISETQSTDDPSLDAVVGMCSGSFSQNIVESELPSTGLPIGDKINIISETQPNLDAVVGMCSGTFSQNLVTSHFPTESQCIGEDVLNLCTGKFYDNQFVSQTNGDVIKDDLFQKQNNQETELTKTEECDKPLLTKIQEDNNLTSILDELNDPEFEESKPKKYFMDNINMETSNVQFKKKFIFDSDDETNNDVSDVKQKKKIKKKKLEKRALQISDDEEDEYDEEYENYSEQDYISDAEQEADRLVEYDSEENEVEIKPQTEKKKRKLAEFFEQEAELTSEDEWVGSGDEDEADLDRMEKEEGDDDTFNQKKLQRELGQIHMRDVLDQDKREVRLIQELLFEDGDLGDGHRQRKFRWRNADGEDDMGTVPQEFGDTQEEEMESEEQWRKQRHEREVFLRQMQNKDESEEVINVSINRTTIIKTSLCSRTISEGKQTASDNTNETTKIPVVLEKKSSKDIPSPKKAFTVFQQSYQGSLLSRGGGALARLGALAAPLADDVALAPTSRRNFVFAALTPDTTDAKVTKRKADTNIGTPRLVKKMKTEDKKKTPRSSLLDHLKV